MALLFLTTRRIALERLWRLWLWDVAGVVPQQALHALQEAACGGGAAGESDAWRRIQAACAPSLEEPSGVAGPPLPPQFLYSLYVHAPPDSKGGCGWPRRAGWVGGCLAGASCDPGPTFPLAAPAASMHWQRQRLAVASGASLAMCCTLLKAPCSPCRSHRPAAAVPGLSNPQASGHRLGGTLNCRSRAAAAQGGAEGSSERKASLSAGGARLAAPAGLVAAAGYWLLGYKAAATVHLCIVKQLCFPCLLDVRRFLLISDADIPLYDPYTFYQQLMHEMGSKVQACHFAGSQSEFWRAEMEVGSSHVAAAGIAWQPGGTSVTDSSAAPAAAEALAGDVSSAACLCADLTHCC